MDNKLLIESLTRHLNENNLYINSLVNEIREIIQQYFKNSLIKIIDFNYKYQVGDSVSNLVINIKFSFEFILVANINIYDDYITLELSMENPSLIRMKYNHKLEDIRKKIKVDYQTPQKLRKEVIKNVCGFAIENSKILSRDTSLLQQKVLKANKGDFKSQLKALLNDNDDIKFGFADNLVLDALNNGINTMKFDIDPTGEYDQLDSCIIEILKISLLDLPFKSNLVNKYDKITKDAIRFLTDHQIKNLLNKKQFIGIKNDIDTITSWADDNNISLPEVILPGDAQDCQDWSNLCIILTDEFFQILEVLNTNSSKIYLKNLKSLSSIKTLNSIQDRIMDWMDF